MCDLSAWFKVGMGEWAGSLQKLPHVIPAAIPVATNAHVSTINSHSGRHNNKLNWYFYLLCYTSAKLFHPNIYCTVVATAVLTFTKIQHDVPESDWNLCCFKIKNRVRYFTISEGNQSPRALLICQICVHLVKRIVV